ncbi:MAG: SNF2-related protein [Phycisphaerales bacterium JB063]
MTQLTAWSPYFHSKARMRGRALQLERKVQRLEPEEGELLRAQVQGDELVTVSLKSDGRQAIIECDSEQAAKGEFCEHLWATLLHLVHEPEGLGAPVSEIVKLKPQPPKARKREGARRPTRSAEPMWMGRLALLRPSAADAQEEAMGVFPVQRQVCYVLLPRASARHNGLVIELRQRVAIASGWGKPKPFKISTETVKALTDPIDREICALLLGATWVTEQEAADAYLLPRSHAMYRVAPHAQRRLLRQMIATGRCVLDDGDALGNTGGELVGLTWDEGEAGETAWTLHLHGVYDEKNHDGELPADTVIEDGEADADSSVDSTLAEIDDDDDETDNDPTPRDLLIDIQARRAGRRIGIEEPELVLGGPDGLLVHKGKVSAFDDREAWRWVAQFRDERFTDDEVERPVMRVPEADVERFLDRLYLLPHLPEIDLPDGLGRAEQTVEPVPHLDLHSPNSTPALELAPTTAKNHLVARLWFGYGEQRVSPVQPGRFVPVLTDAATAGDAAASGEGETADAPADADPVGAADPADPAASGDGSAQAEEHPELAQANSNTEAVAQALPGMDEDADPEEGTRLIRRNRRAERQAIQRCASLGMRHIETPSGDTMLLPVRLMPPAVADLINAGWVIAADQQAVRTAGPPSLSITSGIDWFELRGNVKFTGEDGSEHEVALPDILAAARAGRHMVTLGDGSQGLLPQQWLEEHGLLTAMGQLNGDHLRFRSSQAAMLDALLGERDLVSIDETFQRVRNQIRSFEGVQPIDPSNHFDGQLRSYQKRGLGWLGFLRRFGMGGILADDMGLGKTIQVLAMLQGRKLALPEYTDEWVGRPVEGDPDTKDGEPTRPRLINIIVVPRSVIFNWIDEARKFTPELKVLAYTGPDREQYRDRFEDYDLIVTSFGLMRRDIDFLSTIDFDYAVLDEAQAIKNPQSQSAKAARLLKARHRLALTGTPIENHLGDLWSIFEYLNPGMLGSSAKFAELIRGATGSAGRRGQAGPAAKTGGVVSMPGALPPEGLQAEQAANAAAERAEAAGEKKGDDGQPSRDALVQVASAIRPFILRRTKQQVLTDLPAKTEQTIICEMEPAQRKVYDELRKYFRGNLLRQLDAPDNKSKSSRNGAAGGGGKGLGRAAFMVLEALLRLRQAACHPALIDKTAAAMQFDTLNAPSAKLDELEQRLDEIIDEGSKALVFSQFTSMLGLIRKRLDERGIKYAYLDGQTRNRADVVKRFQTDPDLPVFLISLKAGGVGLNLTSAEYVFIMDPWWNPAVEAQAIDRTHRIGQTKPVFAYRMICEDTVEQRILELQGRKRDLAEAIVGGEENIIANLTRDDLERLLS